MKYYKVKFIHRGNVVETYVKSIDIIEALQKFKKTQKGAELIDISEIEMPLDERIKYLKDLIKEKVLRKKVKLSSYISALRQLNTLLKAGLPLKESLEEIAKNNNNELIKKIFSEAVTTIDSGGKLSDVFAKYEIYVGSISYVMFKLGEETGELDEIVGSLADIYENIYQNIRKVKKALRYPIITIFAIIGAFIFLVTVVVPKFRTVFNQLHINLPFATKLLLWTEAFFRNYGLYIAFTIFMFFLVLIYFYKTDYKIKRKIDFIFLKTYIINKLIFYGNMSRFFDVLSRLINSGIPINNALKISSDIITNDILKEKILITVSVVEQGKTLTQGFIESNVIDELSLRMIESGEKSGELEPMFKNVAVFYEEKLQDIVDNMQSLIEPIIMAVIAAMVLLIALGIFLPMWNMATAIQNNS